jgi:antitoxin (DNA-binding transcriptional repressor) of toxin-antitoxin stability system
MTAITMQEAQANLPAIIGGLQPGEEILIVDQGKPLAAVKKAPQTGWPCEPGCYRKAEFWMAPDFDKPLEDFREYME